jgi:hypothetical protein
MLDINAWEMGNLSHKGITPWFLTKLWTESATSSFMSDML